MKNLEEIARKYEKTIDVDIVGFGKVTPICSDYSENGNAVSAYRGDTKSKSMKTDSYEKQPKMANKQSNADTWTLLDVWPRMENQE